MSMQVMMGIVITVGFTAALFLVGSGFQDPFVEPTRYSIRQPDNFGTVDGKPLRGNGPAYDRIFNEIESRIENDAEKRFQVYKFGVALLGVNDVDRAVEFYKRQLTLFPKDHKIANGLGLCYEKKKMWAEAANAYELAMKINPFDPESKSNLAWILATAPDTSVRDGNKAVALASQSIMNQKKPNPKLMDCLAAAYAEVGAFKKAFRIQQYVSDQTEGKHAGVELRLNLYLENKPYRMAK